MPFSVTFIRLFAQTLLHIIVRVQLKSIVERYERLGLAVAAVERGLQDEVAQHGILRQQGAVRVGGEHIVVACASQYEIRCQKCRSVVEVN